MPFGRTLSPRALFAAAALGGATLAIPAAVIALPRDAGTDGTATTQTTVDKTPPTSEPSTPVAPPADKGSAGDNTQQQPPPTSTPPESTPPSTTPGTTQPQPPTGPNGPRPEDPMRAFFECMAQHGVNIGPHPVRPPMP